MGKWNQRWLPRRKHYYHDPPESFHRSYHTEPEFPSDLQNSVPSWEKQFCTSVGSIPWKKVAFAKHYMHCHDNVVKWNDSAGEEAFNSAKGRFWAAINGLPCDIPHPDPDLYIEEIDWNPHIDPDIIIELDRAYFNPDEEGKKNTVVTTQQKAQSSVPGHNLSWHGNPINGDNNGEGDVKGTGASENVAQGWNQLRGSIDGWENPWEKSCSRDTGLKDNAWSSCGDKSWGWNKGQTSNKQSKNFDGREREWGHVGSGKVKGWGGAASNSWDLDRWETNVHESRKFHGGDAPWSQTLHRGDGRGRDCGDKSWGWKQSWNQNNEPKHLDLRRNSGAWGALNGGCRKRDSSHQYSSRYKRSRFQNDDFGVGHHWSKGRGQKRVSFS